MAIIPQSISKIKGQALYMRVLKRTINLRKFLAGKILTLRNKLQNSSILFTRKMQVVLVHYLYQKRTSEGGHQPTMHDIVWLLMP